MYRCTTHIGTHTQTSRTLHDHQMPRQNLLQQRHGPALQRFGQDRVVGVRERSGGNRPCLQCPAHGLSPTQCTRDVIQLRFTRNVHRKSPTTSKPGPSEIAHRDSFTSAQSSPSESMRMRMSSGMASAGCVSLSCTAALSGKDSNDVRSPPRCGLTPVTCVVQDPQCYKVRG